MYSSSTLPYHQQSLIPNFNRSRGLGYQIDVPIQKVEKGRKYMFYLTHFIYIYIVSEIRLLTTQIMREMDQIRPTLSTTRYFLYAPSQTGWYIPWPSLHHLKLRYREVIKE